jgi:hypothetical protein
MFDEGSLFFSSVKSIRKNERGKEITAIQGVPPFFKKNLIIQKTLHAKPWQSCLKGFSSCF